MQLLGGLKDARRDWKLKEEAQGGTVWRTCCGKGCRPVVKPD